MQPIALFWFRRDLRLHDNAGLYHALRSGLPVLPVFIFDPNILDKLPSPRDGRVEFIFNTLVSLKQELRSMGSDLLVFYGKPESIWGNLLSALNVQSVYTNRDYEPYALERDTAIANLLKARDVAFHTSKDHVIFEQKEVVKADGNPYTVFTPYSRRWLEKLQTKMRPDPDASGQISFYLSSYPVEQYHGAFLRRTGTEKPVDGELGPSAALSDIGFEPSGLEFPPATVSRGLIREYDKTRDFPALDGTSRLGIHFRFGTISIREKARHALGLNKTYLNELIWRDFYSQILANFPHVANRSFNPAYDRVEWRHDPEAFDRWREGKTGYPLVDAGMRQLDATGYMHNRVRMVTASFLTKHLLIDWRLGEGWFAEKLLDFDLASNSGGWQWAAGCGTDAAPYFRIFNPAEQLRKFDPKMEYVRRWVPEYGTSAYPAPMVDHAFARARCLETYKRALG